MKEKGKKIKIPLTILLIILLATIVIAASIGIPRLVNVINNGAPRQQSDYSATIQSGDSNSDATLTEADNILDIDIPDGYYDHVKVDVSEVYQSAYNTGYDSGFDTARSDLCENQAFSANQSSYTTIGTFDFTGKKYLCYRLAPTSQVHIYTAYKFYINGGAITNKCWFNFCEEGSSPGSNDARGLILTGCIAIPEQYQTANQTLQLRCEANSYGATSFNCTLTCFAI